VTHVCEVKAVSVVERVQAATERDPIIFFPPFEPRGAKSPGTRSECPSVTASRTSGCEPAPICRSRVAPLAVRHRTVRAGCLTGTVAVTIYGVCEVTFMMVMYAMESRGRGFVLWFAVAASFQASTASYPALGPSVSWS
jgi:hypothetical protein